MTNTFNPAGDRPAQAADGGDIVSRTQISSSEAFRNEAVASLASPSDSSANMATVAADLPDLSIDKMTLGPVDSSATPITFGILDITKSPSENTAIVNCTTAHDRSEGPLDAPSEQKVSVVFSPEEQEKALQKADFVVRSNGTVEMLHDPEKFRDRQIVIVVESANGAQKPTEAQLQAVDGVTNYLWARCLQNYPKARFMVEQSPALDRANKESFERAWMPEATRQQVDAMDRIGGTGGGAPASGDMSRQEVDEYFPPREVPQQQGETKPLMAMKDTVAGMFNAEKKHPYETVRPMTDGSFAVGRYGLNDDLIFNWFASMPEFDEVLGHPPDWSKLAKLMEKLVKKGKVSKEFAAKFSDPKFAGEFGSFMQKIAGGKGDVTSTEVKEFLPNEFQEQIAGDLIERFAKESKGDPQSVALAMHLGKPIEELAQKDMENNQKFCGAALKMYGLAIARQQSDHSDRIEWHDGGSGSGLAFRVAHAAERNALNNNTVGWCYREVADTLDNFGIHLYGGSAYMAADQLARNKRVHEVSMKDLRAGDILVHGATAAHEHGHIAVYLGNGKEASDHVQTLITGRGYGGTRVFRMNG